MVLVVLFCSLGYANWWDESIEQYQSYLHDYHHGIGSLREEIDLMSVFRLYRLHMIGGVKNDDRFYDVPILMERVFQEYKSDDFLSDLALSAFLSYVVSDLFDRPYIVEEIKRFRSFNNTHNAYVSSIREEAVSYFQIWIAHSLGIVPEPPDELFSVAFRDPLLRSRIRISYDPDPLLYETISGFFDAPIVQQRLDEAVRRTIADSGARLTDDQMRTLIRRNALFTAAPLVDLAASGLSDIAREFVGVTPDSENFWLWRWCVYGIVFFLAILFKKRLMVLIGIIGTEMILLAISQNIFYSPVDSLIWGLLAIALFLFALVLHLSKLLRKKTRTLFQWIALLGIFGILFMGFCPIISNPEGLRMNEVEGFHESRYYPILAEELYIWSRSHIAKVFLDFDNRSISAQEAGTQLSNRIRNVVPYASEPLRNDINNYLTSRFENPSYHPFREQALAAWEEAYALPVRAPNLYIWQITSLGSFWVFAAFLVSLYMILPGFRWKSRIMSILLCLSLILPFFINRHNLQIETGYPIISIERYTWNLWVLIIGAGMILLSFFLSSKHQRRDNG